MNFKKKTLKERERENEEEKENRERENDCNVGDKNKGRLGTRKKNLKKKIQNRGNEEEEEN